MIGIVDYGMGNLTSIRNMIMHVGGEGKLIDRPDDLLQADKTILPGVGAFDNGMRRLRERGFIDVLNEFVAADKPVLGICLGMQLMTMSSDEGSEPGLGWFNAHTKKIADLINGSALRIPHMGWNKVSIAKSSPLISPMDDEARFYFVHSYAVRCVNSADVLLECQYGASLTAGISRDNLFGVQFHPEKSHKFGMQILRNFNSI